VQYFPIQSVYRWKGAVEAAQEYLLRRRRKNPEPTGVIDFIRKHHTYEVPQIVVTPITGGLPDYLNWIRKRRKRSPDEGKCRTRKSRQCGTGGDEAGESRPASARSDARLGRCPA